MESDFCLEPSFQLSSQLSAHPSHLRLDLTSFGKDFFHCGRPPSLAISVSFPVNFKVEFIFLHY